jgi:excisionase family DNA binding protein
MAEAVAIPKLISARQVAEATGLPYHRVFELAREGKIPCVRLGRSVWFTAEAVAAVLAGRSAAAGQPEAAGR